MSLPRPIPNRAFSYLREQHCLLVEVHDRHKGSTCPHHSYNHSQIQQVVGMNWIEVPAGKYRLVTGKDKRSHCQIELHMRYFSLRSKRV